MYRISWGPHRDMHAPLKILDIYTLLCVGALLLFSFSVDVLLCYVSPGETRLQPCQGIGSLLSVGQSPPAKCLCVFLVVNLLVFAYSFASERATKT